MSNGYRTSYKNIAVKAEYESLTSPVRKTILVSLRETDWMRYNHDQLNFLVTREVEEKMNERVILISWRRWK